MAGGHVFCAPRNLCVFLFTYLSFTNLLNVDCSWSIFSTPGKILYTSQQLSMPTIPSEGASIISFKTQPRESSSRPYSDAQLYLRNDDDLFVQ